MKCENYFFSNDLYLCINHLLSFLIAYSFIDLKPNNGKILTLPDWGLHLFTALSEEMSERAFYTHSMFKNSPKNTRKSSKTQFGKTVNVLT